MKDIAEKMLEELINSGYLTHLERLGAVRMEYREIKKKAVCRCAKCGWIIEFCTRDNPCPACGSSSFKVEYER